MTMHIKICGLTCLDDALAAIDAGADYLGFNFYPQSPRYISPADCARIISALLTRHSSPLTFVGVFVNEPPASIATILNDCGLDLAQLHGDEPPEYLTVLGGRAFKAVRLSCFEKASSNPCSADTNVFTAFVRFSAGSPSLLVDAHTPHAYGGTGKRADWQAARALAAQFPIFLAGGLTPENVAAAIAHVKPWGVDVASGVESTPGRKDHRRMRAFVEAVRESVGG